jgi:N-acetylglucosamine-6-sulfatase
MTQPRIIVIRCDDLDARAVADMPNLQALFPKRWKHSLVTVPLCDPSRVSYLTGQYAHNHGHTINGPSFAGTHTIATDLQAAGYKCVHIGKFLTNDISPGPGWDEWYTTEQTRYYNYQLNANGTITTKGSAPQDYHTDFLTRKACQVLEAYSGPLYLQIDINATHLAFPVVNGSDWPIPAPRHIGAAASWTPTNAPSYDEADLSDKPPHFQGTPLMTPAQHQRVIDLARRRRECLMSVDELVAEIVSVDQNALVFVTSDNGWHAGEHRIDDGKSTAFEEAIRVPLFARNLGSGEEAAYPVSTVDLAPTILNLAGATAAGRVLDGVDLLGTVTRNAVLVELWYALHPTWKRFEQMRKVGRSYTRHFVGVDPENGPTVTEEEAYDLVADPYQLDAVAPTAADRLKLDRLTACSGTLC